MHRQPSPADTVLYGGRVFTADTELGFAEALAVRGREIAAVGTTQEVRRLEGETTRVIDLAGRMVMPGLIDGHCHATKGAVAALFSCKFEFSASPDDIARALAVHLDRSNTDFVIGGRWASDFFDRYPLASPRAWLDDHSGDRAVYLRDDTGHNGWANSRALARLGIDANTHDPPGGSILRDPETGEPNGLLLEAADVDARARLPDWSPEQYRAGVIEMVAIANRLGITGLIDADANEGILRALQEVDREGGLHLHVAACITTPYGHRDTPLDVGVIEELRDRYASEHVDTRFAKIYQDGVPTTARTAAMLDPYLPDPRYPEDFRGHLHVDPEVLAQDFEALERRGFTVKVHTAGDRSVRTTLDAIEQARRATGRRDLHHQLAHPNFVHPSDLPRFRELGAVADLSPYLWHPTPVFETVRAALGTKRADRCWPIRDLLEAGAPVLAGSDWPAAVASMDPWIGLATLVTRRDPAGRVPGALWPEQAISLERALQIFTRDGAAAIRREETTGTLRPGRSADLVVLNQDLFSVAPDRIADTEVALTLFEGELVFEA